MKIQTPLADDPLNLPRKSAALKPLAGEDFRDALATVSNGSAATQPVASAEAPVAPRLRPLADDPMVPGSKGEPRPLEPLKAAAPPIIPLDESDTEFAQGLPQHKTQDPHDKVVETARKLVAQTFYGAMLKQMRNSPFKSELFEGGRGGQAFSPLLDQHLAEHMTRATDNQLVNAIARKLEGRAAYQQHQQQLSAARRAARSTPNVRTPHVAPSLRA